MVERDELADRELIARLFAMLTARFEDAAALAAGCQARDGEEGRLREALSVLASSNDEVATLIAAADRVLRCGDHADRS